jgi:phosphate acetyltransferase
VGRLRPGNTAAERYVAPLAQLRRHKGWREEMARDHLADPIMVGTMMLQQGEVDGMVAVAVRPAL